MHCDSDKYECDKCKKAFKYKSKLSKHIIHSNVHEFDCDGCEKAIQIKRLVTKHLKTYIKKHLELKTFSKCKCVLIYLCI